MNDENKMISQPPRIVWKNILMDFILLAAWYFLLDKLISWQTGHLVLSGVIVMALNIAAAGFGMIVFFSIYNSENDLEKYSQLAGSAKGAIIGISALLTFIATFWWLVPAQALRKKELFPVYNGLTMLAYFLFCISIMATAINTGKWYAFSKSDSAEWISILLNAGFFFFSYGLLIVSVQIWSPSGILYQMAAAICLVLFYLPLRIFLLLRPPFHKAELFSVIISFSAMLINLYSKI